jgi:hypothetical protein
MVMGQSAPQQAAQSASPYQAPSYAPTGNVGQTPEWQQQAFAGQPYPGSNLPQPPTQEEWLQDPATAYQKAIAYDRATQFDPAIQQTREGLAQMARTQATMKYADEFKRWGPEIDLLASQLPTDQRSAQAFDWIVDMVRGRHAHEIREEEIEQRVQERIEAGSIVRPQPSAPGASPTDVGHIDLGSDELPAWFRDECAKVGIKPRDLDDFLLTTKFYGTDLMKARKDYLAALKRDGAVADRGGQ